jgi:arylsulfatase A-like enzyme/Flp pilus assembly protein TadD
VRSLLVISFSSICLLAVGIAVLRHGCSIGSRLNVVMVTIDTVRADHIGCYGFGPARTPSLDNLAKNGVLFEQARTCVPITLPAHASILTGMLPPHHGIRDNAAATLSGEAQTLTERFRDNGWSTGAFVGSYVLNRQFGLYQGFDVYDDVPDRYSYVLGAQEERRANEVMDAAITWLHQQKRKPFFLWIHLFDPHAPYSPPSPYAEQFKRRPYDGEIAFADQQVGRLVQTLDALGRLSTTLMIVTSDHGEGLGEHGEETHAILLYDATLRVPLIFSGPGIPKGRRVSENVSLVDIAPTLVDLMGFLPLEESQGRSFRGLLAGQPFDRPPIYFESYCGYRNMGLSPLVGLLDGPMKIIDSPRPELYDLGQDPHELKDLYKTSIQTGREFRRAARYRYRQAQTERRFSQPYDLSLDERARLEALGYLEGPAEPVDVWPLPSADLPNPKDHIKVESARQQVLELINRGELQAAETVARRALDSSPRNVLLMEYLGSVLALQKRYADALDPLSRCLQIVPTRASARINLAICLHRLGRYDEAARQARECLRFRPDWAKALAVLAQTETKRGRFGEARRAWRRFLENWRGDQRLTIEARRALAAIEKAANQE